MKVEAATFEEAEAIINPLIAEDKWAINVVQKTNGTFSIQWLEHKKYTAHDGKEFHDEIWTTREGEMNLVQDLEPEHVRNILRMMLRNEREASKAMNSFFKQMVEEIQEMGDDESDEEIEKKILH
jgi:hypothetical protein